MEERKKMHTILEILRSMDPAPMHFSNFFPKDALESEKASGLISLMLSMNVIKPSGTDPFSFGITPTGIEFLALPKTEQGRMGHDFHRVVIMATKRGSPVDAGDRRPGSPHPDPGSWA